MIFNFKHINLMSLNFLYGSLFTQVLLGEGAKHGMDQIMPTKAGVRTVLEVLKIQSNYWSSLESRFLKLHSEWGWHALQEKSKYISELLPLPFKWFSSFYKIKCFCNDCSRSGQYSGFLLNRRSNLLFTCKGF